MTIKTALDEKYNYKNRFRGTYLHGYLEEQYGYDIFAFGRKKGFAEGIHNLTIIDNRGKEQDVTFFLWKGEVKPLAEWRGFLVLTIDKKAYQYALKCYTERKQLL